MRREGMNMARLEMRGRWAVIFSHPEDFLPCGFEVDRWKTMMARALSSGEVRLLTLASSSGSNWGRDWISAVTHDERHVLSCDSQLRRFFDATRASSGDRFVTIIDDTLSPRRTFVYEHTTNLP